MIPIHNHSYYSALDGFSSPDEIAARVKELGLDGAFITDHGTVAGVYAFKKAMDKLSLFSGFGMEAYQSRDTRLDQESPRNETTYHLILLAQSHRGFLNLMRLSDEANRTGFRWVPRVDWELLEKYKEGVIATSACMGSLLCRDLSADNEKEARQTLHKMRRIFGDRYFIELNTYDSDEQRVLNERLVDLAEEFSVRLIYANDAHYSEPDQYLTHEAFLCAQMGTWIGANKSKKGEEYHKSDPTKFHPQCLYIMGEKEVRESLSNLPQWAVDEAIAHSDEIREICEFTLPESKIHFPKFKTDNAKEMFIDLIELGLETKYGEEPSEEVLTRTETEAEAIIGANLHDYFLIVWDYVNHALNRGKMVGPGRGSVGGSLVAYLLDITTIDPLKYNLQFERFWNPGRSEGLPDIDIDFAREARYEEIEYVKNKYGEDRVLPIGNHLFLWPKSAIDKAGMVLWEKPPYGSITNIKKIMEQTTDAGKLMGWTEMMEEVEDELRPYMDQYPELFEYAEKFSGRLAAYGIHASAVVISDVDIQDFLPARRASEDDGVKIMVTQAEMHQVEDLGFPKFDFLGLRNLDTLVRAASLSGEFDE